MIGALPRTPGFFKAWQRAPNGRILNKIAGGMATCFRGSCPLTFFATPSVASVLTIPWRVASQHCPPPFGQKRQALGAGTKWLFWPGFLVGDNKWLRGLVLGVVPPVRLHEHGVDLFEIDDFGLVSDGFYKGAGQRKIALQIKGKTALLVIFLLIDLPRRCSDGWVSQ